MRRRLLPYCPFVLILNLSCDLDNVTSTSGSNDNSSDHSDLSNTNPNDTSTVYTISSNTNSNGDASTSQNPNDASIIHTVYNNTNPNDASADTYVISSDASSDAWQPTSQSDINVPIDEEGRNQIEIPDSDVRVILDPYGIAPLSSIVLIDGIIPDIVQSVKISIQGLDGEDLKVSLSMDSSFYIRYGDPELVPESVVGVPVLGLYPSHDNNVDIEIIGNDVVYRTIVTISTEPLHSSLPTIEIVESEPSNMEPGWNLAGFHARESASMPRPFIYDQYGRIRWVLMVDEVIPSGLVTPMEPLQNGNLLLAINDSVYEYSLLGRQVNRWLLPDGFRQHHDVYEMPDGNFLVCGENTLNAGVVNDNGVQLAGSDEVIEIDRKTAQVRNIWDLRQFLDVDRYTYIKTRQGKDWYHLNAVYYSSEDDTIIISGKHQGVVKITRGDANPDDPYMGKQLRWILAPHLGWDRAGANGTGIDLRPYLLTAVDSEGVALPQQFQDGTESSLEFGWVYSQHAPVVLNNGDLYVFDNGDRRDLGNYSGQSFSRGVIFRIEPGMDDVGGTVRQIWEYGRERGEDLYAPVISDVDVGPVTGNRFIMPGTLTTSGGMIGGAAKVVEVRPSDNRIVFEAHIIMKGRREWGGDLVYRQERLDLYP